MNVARWQKLHAQATGSYVVQVDIRELEYLCNAALNLRMLVEAVRLQAKIITVADERNRFLELVADIEVLDGPLPPEAAPCS